MDGSASMTEVAPIPAASVILLRGDYRELADYEQPPLTAINESYAPPDSVLREGDELAFIPPVAGG